MIGSIGYKKYTMCIMIYELILLSLQYKNYKNRYTLI